MTETLIWIVKEERLNFEIITGKSANLVIFHITLNLSSERQSRRWANQLEVGGTKKEKLLKVPEYVIQKLRNTIEVGYILHDRDLRQWALKEYKDLGDNSMVFKASRKWNVFQETNEKFKPTVEKT